MIQQYLQLDMGGKTPRVFQARTVQLCRDLIAAGHRALIICLPTGAGKTFIACMFMLLGIKKQRRTVFIAHRRELIRQASEHLVDCSIFHGIILAQHHSRFQPDAPVQVASRQTLASRVLRSLRMPLPRADILVIDEAHGSVSKENLSLIKMFRQQNPKLVILGLTATPARGDDKGLGDLYSTIVQPVTYSQLREDGFLVPCRVFVFHVPNMKRVRAAEWDEVAARKVDTPKLVGDIFENWKTHAGDRKTIAFAKSIDHALHIHDLFQQRGVAVAHVDQSTPIKEREDMLEDFANGRTQVVTNVGILTEGYDNPKVSAIIGACPTRSLVKFMQMCGRALRICPEIDKRDCILLDHGGMVFTHGMFPDDDIEWPLEKSKSAVKELTERRQKGEHREPNICEKCFASFYGTLCPNCGSRRIRLGRDIAVKHGLLREIKRKTPRLSADAPHDAKVQYWHRCLAVMFHKGQSAGSAARMYQSHVGEPPWQTGDLPNLPVWTEWKKTVRELFPQYGNKISR